MSGRLIHVLTASALAIPLAGGITTSSQAMPLPVTSVQEIAGTAPTEQVQWWRGRGWGGYGWGWRRPYYGGGALAAGFLRGGLPLGGGGPPGVSFLVRLSFLLLVCVPPFLGGLFSPPPPPSP